MMMKLEDEIYFKNTMMQFCLIIKGKTVERAADLVVLLRSGSVLRKWSDPYSYSVKGRIWIRSEDADSTCLQAYKN